MDTADWAYLYSHLVVTVGALMFIYLRRNDSFYFVRNMFMIAMLIALVGYAAVPDRAAPADGRMGLHRLDPAVHRDQDRAGPGSALLNAYAAVPSMHVCFALMIGAAMARLVAPALAQAAVAACTRCSSCSS